MRQIPCAHCGLPASQNSAGPSYCCAGCRTAHQLMREAGLERYYELRDRLGDPAMARPMRDEVRAGAYAHFDDPEYLAAHGHAPGRADLHVTGLHCAACVWVIDRLPAVLDGVDEARVDFGTGRLRLRWDPARVQLGEIARFLHRIGYPTHAHDAHAAAQRQRLRRLELVRLAVAGACAGNVMLASIALYAGDSSGMSHDFRRLFEYVALLMTIPAVSYGAWPFFRGAWSGIRVGRLHMDLPIALGLGLGFGGSLVATLGGPGAVYYDSVSMLVFLLLLGRFVQQRGQEWAISRGALLHLLLPGTAMRARGEAWEEVSSGLLAPGDRVRVAPDERFPADGAVLEGWSDVDLSKLTGESAPLRVGPGDSVLAGTTNLGAALTVAVEAVGERTRIGALVESIDRAGEGRAPIVELSDRIAGWFVAAVLSLAAVGGLAWCQYAPERAVEVVIALLVVSCPCALGLATPSALAVARGRAARAGILMSDTATIEALARVRRVVFDKTGTLTEGRMRVGEVVAGFGELVGPRDEPSSLVWNREIATLVLAAERASRHPVAAALRTWALVHAEPPPSSVAVERREEAGCGVVFAYGERRLRIGRSGWADAGDDGRGVDGADATAGSGSAAIRRECARLAEAGMTPVLLAEGARVLAIFGVGDQIRPGMARSLAALRGAGIELALRSGDDPRVVSRVAAQLGIDDAAGRCSPESKAAEIVGDSDVAMIGDGVNDAPALRAAAVGIAVGGGAEAALRVADVHLERPEATHALLLGARRALRIVRRNLAFSLAYNLLFATLALMGLITPLLAALLMPLSSLTVLGSSVFGRSFDATA